VMSMEHLEIILIVLLGICENIQTVLSIADFIKRK
jgi:hypothetical protein